MICQAAVMKIFKPQSILRTAAYLSAQLGEKRGDTPYPCIYPLIHGLPLSGLLGLNKLGQLTRFHGLLWPH